jgi:hypothetical protein
MTVASRRLREKQRRAFYFYSCKFSKCQLTPGFGVLNRYKLTESPSEKFWLTTPPMYIYMSHRIFFGTSGNQYLGYVYTHFQKSVFWHRLRGRLQKKSLTKMFRVQSCPGAWFFYCGNPAGNGTRKTESLKKQTPLAQRFISRCWAKWIYCSAYRDTLRKLWPDHFYGTFFHRNLVASSGLFGGNLIAR